MPFAITDFNFIYAVGETETETWKSHAKRNDVKKQTPPRAILPATPALVNNFPLHGERIEWGVLGNGTLCMASEVGNVD